MNYAVKILACSVVLVLHTAISMFGGFFLMIGMKGFISSNIPIYGFLLYFVWAFITTIILITFVMFMADKKQINHYLAAVIAIVVSTILSAIIMFIGLFASLSLVSFLAS